MMNKGCSSGLINSSSNRHRVSLAEWLSSGFIRPYGSRPHDLFRTPVRLSASEQPPARGFP